MKLDLLTNATVVDDAIRFVLEHGKSTTTVLSEAGTDAAEAIKPKTNTVESLSNTFKKLIAHASNHLILYQQIKFFEGLRNNIIQDNVIRRFFLTTIKQLDAEIFSTLIHNQDCRRYNLYH